MYGTLAVIVLIPPGFVLIPILNIVSALIPVTSNNPLNPELSSPFSLLALLSLLTSTMLPTLSLCGLCDVMIPELLLESHVASIIALFVLRFDTDVRFVLSFL